MKRTPFLRPVAGANRYALTAALIIAGMFCVAATSGRQHIGLLWLPEWLAGKGAYADRWLFWQLWLPRATVAVGVGAALAIAGGVFQTLTRNPLASPDIIGINAGAAAGAVGFALLLPDRLPAAAAALIGAAVAGLLVTAAAYKHRRFGTHALIAGIAVNALAVAVVRFALTAIRQEDAWEMAAWLSGSLAQRSWPEAALIWTALTVCCTVLLLLAHPLNILAGGRQLALGVGVDAAQTSFVALTAATALSAAAVVCAGPVAFVSLAAPHIVRKILQTERWLLLPTALTGSLLLLCADLAARLLPLPTQLPVGVFTAAFGGLYLCILLFGRWHRR